MRILHVGHYDKFLPKHIMFTNENFDSKDHFFLMMDKEKKIKRVEASNVKYISHKSLFLNILPFYKADKIILHGLFEKRILHLLFLNPWLIKKCYWMIWGGDLYNYLANKDNPKKRSLEFFRRFVIGRLKHFITYIPGDYKKAAEWYGAKGEVHECLLYHSNLYNSYDLPEASSRNLNVLLGNSASLSNNHEEALELLSKFKREDLQIYSPLSYGKESQRKKIIKKGKKLFGDRFEPLVDLMPFEDYLAFLSKIDIAVFNHKRQQAMGNTINLLGLGKKVYINPEVTPFQLFKDIGIKVFDIQEFDCDKDFPEREKNIEVIKKHFSEERLLSQWKSVYS